MGEQAKERKRIAVLTMDKATGKFYAQQLADLFGEYADIDTYSREEGTVDKAGPADVYAVSTYFLPEKEGVARILDREEDTVMLRMTITRKSLGTLMALPMGTKAMMVNLSRAMANETMVLLDQMGVKNVEFTPVYPGMETVPDLKLAITPAEVRHVPKGVKEIIDIGHRVIHVDTIIEIALKLGYQELLEQERFHAYMNEIVSDSYSFNRLFGRSLWLESQMSSLLSTLKIGLVGVDAVGRITTFNEKAEYVLDMKAEGLLDRPATQALPFLPFEECCRERGEARPRLIRVGDMAINATLTPVMRGEKYIGAFAVVERFDDEEKKQHILRRQLMHRGYTTKYTFEDIEGESPSIQNAIRIARKMAGTNSAILISGESGTGKELFAHAIHNASPRREEPFVAINCAAIPDNLFESELFGYEEGAFTGAKKGGKPGLFELAHRGTLFLDEIEGISPVQQVKLLRAIQEKEVLRVGGHRIVSVDVRIVAATNENLAQMVDEGKFRRDLYYRLNTLPLQLPPLRQRGDDVLMLMEGMRRELGRDFALAPETVEILRRHPWNGNIRELRNCVEYLIYTGGEVIQPSDLPPYFAPAEPPAPSQDLRACCDEMGGRQEDYRFVLEELDRAQQEGRATGRKYISQQAEGHGLFLTEQEVRSILLELERLGAAKLSKGRGGSKITARGKELLAQLERME